MHLDEKSETWTAEEARAWAPSKTVPSPDFRFEAAVVEGLTPEGRVLLRREGKAQVESARRIASAPLTPHPGDRVLLARAPEGTLYLFSILESDSPDLVFEAPRGDIQLKAPRGSIRIESTEGIELNAGHREEASRLRMKAEGVALDGEALTAKLGVAQIDCEETRFSSDLLRIAAQRAYRKIDHLETKARRIIERSENTYREVEGLLQNKTGRLRLVAKDSIHALGRLTSFKAREDMKIKGKKVHLG